MQPRHNTQLHGLLPPFPGHGCINDLKIERSFELQATYVTDVIRLFFDMLYNGVCTTKHRETSSQLVQEFNVCTVWLPQFKTGIPSIVVGYE